MRRRIVSIVTGQLALFLLVTGMIWLAIAGRDVPIRWLVTLYVWALGLLFVSGFAWPLIQPVPVEERRPGADLYDLHNDPRLIGR